MTDDHQHSGHFDAAMPLPDEVQIPHSASKPAAPVDSTEASQKAAADLVRQRVEAAYANAPPAAEEIYEIDHQAKSVAKSKHQLFIEELLASGKSLPEIQAAWHEYYAALPDKEKHEVWQEFYAEHAQNSQFSQTTKPSAKKPAKHPVYQHKDRLTRKAGEFRNKVAPRPSTAARTSAAAPIHSLLFGLGIGGVVIIIFLFSFFNERFIAPFIQPSRNATNTPIISDTAAVSTSPEIVIPKINVEIPVVYTVTTADADTVENALEDGVVHYADTALPGQDGNGVIVGHSSNNILNPGKYKFAFVLLSRLDNGDTFYLQKDGVRYTYQVYKKSIVSPSDVSVLGAQDKPATFTLITCDPPGTSTNRLVVVAQQISPDPSSNLAAASSNNTLATKTAILPGNSVSLWARFTKWIGG